MIGHGTPTFIHPFKQRLQMLTETEVAILILETVHPLQGQTIHRFAVGPLGVIPHDYSPVGDLPLEELLETME
jgi:hypothetical protein